MERQALAKEKDEASKERLAKVEKEIADLKEQSSALRAQWQNEKSSIDRANAIQEEIEQLKTELERRQREGNLGRASEIQYGILPARRPP